jgi:hypothetical protein
MSLNHLLTASSLSTLDIKGSTVRAGTGIFQSAILPNLTSASGLGTDSKGTIIAGSAGGGGGTGQVTFAPGGTASGNTVFTSFTSLCTYLATLPQDQLFTINCDFSSVSNNSFNLAAGTYTLPRRIKFIGLALTINNTSFNAILGTTADSIFAGNGGNICHLELDGVRLSSSNLTNPVITCASNVFKLNAYNGGGIIVSGSHTAVIAITGSDVVDINLNQQSVISANVSGHPALTLDNTSAANLSVVANDQSEVTDIAVSNIANIQSAGIQPSADAFIGTSYFSKIGGPNGTFYPLSITWTGPITSTVTAGITASGSMVTLFLPLVTGTSSSSAAFSSGQVIPSQWVITTTSAQFPVLIQQNNQQAVGLLTMLNDGSLTIYASQAGATFTNTEQCQIQPQFITWIAQQT